MKGQMQSKPPADKADLKSGQSQTYFIVLRYADILLMFAKPLSQSDPGNGDILMYLNMVRARSACPILRWDGFVPSDFPWLIIP